MKAQTLSICMPGMACNKNCPYCVSRMTWAPKEDECSWLLNLPKVAHFARMAQVTDVIITGKGEPTINPCLTNAVIAFREWPVVLQTNGKHWSNNPEAMNTYVVHGLEVAALINIVQVSIDHPDQMSDYEPLWKKINSCPPTTSRITVMLTPEVCKLPFMGWLDLCKKQGIRGLSFREVTIPTDCQDTPEAKKTAAWICLLEKNKVITDWKNDFNDKFYPKGPTKDCCPMDPRTIRRLPYGAVIKDFDGISVTKFEYCIQDSNGDDDIRSLVYNQDGHLYTTWSSPASMIF